MDTLLLKKLGFSDKSAKVYLALLSLGPSSVRVLAEKTGLNRGTAYDMLKWLEDEGLVSFYKKDAKQHFVAESPEKLHRLVERKKEELEAADDKLEKMVEELKALHDKGGERPVARYFSGSQLHRILEDVLAVCEQSEAREYRVYSTEGIREHLYKNFPTFSDARIAKGISVKVIAIGGGGELRGLDERKRLDDGFGGQSASPQAVVVPTYIILYPEKTAYISLNAKAEPIGVVIENNGVYETQRIVFDSLWDRLDIRIS